MPSKHVSPLRNFALRTIEGDQRGAETAEAREARGGGGGGARARGERLRCEAIPALAGEAIAPARSAPFCIRLSATSRADTRDRARARRKRARARPRSRATGISSRPMLFAACLASMVVGVEASASSESRPRPCWCMPSNFAPSLAPGAHGRRATRTIARQGRLVRKECMAWAFTNSGTRPGGRLAHAQREGRWGPGGCVLTVTPF